MKCFIAILLFSFTYCNKHIMCKDNVEKNNEITKKKTKDSLKKTQDNVSNTNKNISKGSKNENNKNHENNSLKIDVPTDMFSDIDDNFELFFNNNQRNLLDNIPITISVNKEILNFNLYVRKKEEQASTYNKNIFTLFKISNKSVDILFKLKMLHNKIWGSLEKKHQNNKFIKYVKSHFEPSIGLFYENNSHSNYYKLVVKKHDDANIKKDITVNVSTNILRIGPIFKMSWFIDDSRKINSSFMVSVGWQTNLYFSKCCFHYKDTWFTTYIDYGGFNNMAYNEYTIQKRVYILPVYLMLHLDFAYYFFKVYVRFYSPIGRDENVKHALFNKNDEYMYSDKNDVSITDSDNERKLILNKWTMSVGFSLAL